MNYRSETFPEGAVLRIFADANRAGVWRIQVQGKVAGLVDLHVLGDLEIELGEVEEDA